MTDQQFLGVNAFSNQLEIKNALKKKIADLDFEINIETIFKYIHCSQRLIQKTDNLIVADEIIITDQYREFVKDFNKNENYDTPEKLIAHFTLLYDNPEFRFNKLLWKSAVESLKRFDHDVKLEDYLQPVVDFLNSKPFLKSEVLKIIANTLPFGNFFNRPKTDENGEFWRQYDFVYNLLRYGNLSFDLHADILNTGEFTSEQLDIMYALLMNSVDYYHSNNLFEAFKILQEGISANVKPLLIWQRQLNILYKIIFTQKDESVFELFEETLNDSLTSFPFDEELLYMRVKFFFKFYEPQKCKDEIITTLRIIPDHDKSLFLLGKCYLKLGISRAAVIIFENLKKINPLNMQYVTASAVASRQYIDFCINEHDPKDNSREYYISILNTLTEKEMFDEVAAFAVTAPQEDGDIKALLLYAKDVENYLFTGQKNKNELINALSFAKDKEIIRKIKEYYLKDIPDWNDIKAEENFIQKYYDEFSNDSMANYQLGMLHYAQTDYENAYNYFVKAKEIDPANIMIYYNLARLTALLGIHSEALEYINIYLVYNKYNVIANEIYCDCTYALQQYQNTHNGSKWLLSICREEEFDPKYFFYFTTSLSYHMDKFEDKYHNLAYVNDMLELYDQYPKPDNFWINDNGSRSMYWAANLCYTIGHFEKGVEYLQCILENVKEYNWPLIEKCKFQLLPESLHALQQYEKLVKLLETPTIEVLEKQENDPSVRLSCFYISYAYSVLGNEYKRMQWALQSVNCFMQMDNPPIDWADNYLLKNFETCLEEGIDDFIIPVGKKYLEIIKTPKTEHIWLTHHLANFYSKKGNQEEALQYHRMCVDFGIFFPDEEMEIINNSKLFINSFN